MENIKIKLKENIQENLQNLRARYEVLGKEFLHFIPKTQSIRGNK